MNLEIHEKYEESEKMFDEDELYYAQPEIFSLVEDGDLKGLNDYLMQQFYNASRKY